MNRISSIVFDRKEQPKRATIITSAGTVKVEWRNVCGDRAWFTSVAIEARKLAVTHIERIERLTQHL